MNAPGPGERDALEARLPLAMRGPGTGHQRLLETVAHRVAVAGTHGTRRTVRLVGHALRVRGWTTLVHLWPGEGEPVDAAIWEFKRAWPVDAAVLEAPLVGERSMRVFCQRVLRPTHLLVPSVQESADGAHIPDLYGLARGLVRSVGAGAVVVTTEGCPDLCDAMADEARRVGARFVGLPTPPPLGGAAIHALASEVLSAITGERPSGSDLLTLEALAWEDEGGPGASEPGQPAKSPWGEGAIHAPLQRAP